MSEEPVEETLPESEPEVPVESEEPSPPVEVQFVRKDDSFRGVACWYVGEGFRLLVHIPDPGFESVSYRWSDTDPIVFDESTFGTIHPDVRDVSQILERLNYVTTDGHQPPTIGEE